MTTTTATSSQTKLKEHNHSSHLVQGLHSLEKLVHDLQLWQPLRVHQAGKPALQQSLRRSCFRGKIQHTQPTLEFMFMRMCGFNVARSTCSIPDTTMRSTSNASQLRCLWSREVQ